MQDYDARRRTYLETVAALPCVPMDAQSGIFNLLPMEVFTLIPRLELGAGPIDESLLMQPLCLIERRRDCADFALAGLIRVLYQYPETPLLSAEQHQNIESAVLGFCYWYDQPGIQGMCFHTENHQILFHCCELLAGQKYRERIFENSGQTGQWHVDQATKRVHCWIDERVRFGFSEWLSCYFEEDLLALVSLYDFAEDTEIRRRAEMLIDLILFTVVLHSHQGVMGGTHGRTYAEFVKGSRQDPTTAINWLVFGSGVAPERATLALTALATSAYRCPAIIQAIAQDTSKEIWCRERHGVNVEEASRYGLDIHSLDDALFFWACQTSRHPKLRDTAFLLAERADDPWLTNFIATTDAPLEKTRVLIEEAGGVFDGDAVNTALSEVNLVTYRTPDYLLSCAQDFRPGKPGYQQHPWQATLSIDAVVFTNHPGSETEDSAHSERPNFWAGNRYLPRTAQHRNVLCCIHHVPADDRMPFSHAYFPRAHFDETYQLGNWTFGRKDNGYIALYSQKPAIWSETEFELTVDVRDNIWICEMGSLEQNGSFENFVTALTSASVICDGLSVTYVSPTQGEMHFDWNGPLRVRGEAIELSSYPRFDNPYCHAEFGDRCFTVSHGQDQLIWDFERKPLASNRL